MPRLPRRDFLQAGAATALATSSLFHRSPARAEEPATQTGWLRKTLKIGMISGKGEGGKKLSLTERFALAKQAGFAGVELNTPGINIDEAKAAAQASGLIIDGTVGSYHWGVRHTDPKPEVRKDALSKLIRGIEETAAVGADTMLLVPGHGKDGTDDEVHRRAVAAIREALPTAKKHKVAILIENVWNDFCYDHEGGNDQTAERLANFIDVFDSPLVGVQFDIGNHWKYGDPADWIRTLGPRIQKLDIKGFSRAQGGFTKITEGDINWPEVKQALRDIKFTGWLAAEVGGGGLERLKEVNEHLEESLQCSERMPSAG